jgi:signal transduction histidine kinase
MRALAATALRPDFTRLGWVYLVVGGSYPLWHALAPSTALDPPWIWWAIGGLFVATGAHSLLRHDDQPGRWFYLPSFAVALHLQGLVASNPTHPFYAFAAAMNVVTTVLVLQEMRVLIAYAVLVFGTSGALLLFQGESGPLFYWVSVAWVLALAYRRFSRQLLEKEMAESLRCAGPHPSVELAHLLGLHQRKLEDRLEHEKSKRMQLQEELHLAQHMESIGRLAGGLAHEFNNQLMTIRIYAELMEKQAPPVLAADLEKIKAATDEAAELTARLVRFSRPRTAHDEIVDLRAVVEECLPMLRHLMGETTTTRCQLAKDSCWVAVGRERVEQVLVNLALNARDAMPDGGTFTVTLTRHRREAVELPPHLAGIDADEWVALEVSDTGVGIEPAARSQVFDPFFTTKADRGRMGLGLFIVYGSVTESGGHVRLTSEPGKGARFELYWPAATPRATQGAKLPIRRAADIQKARILLVEDQPEIRRGLVRWLVASGHSVVEAETAEEALEHFDEGSGSVDLVATDVVLPGMDGLELIGQLRKRDPGVPALAFSGHLDHLSRTSRVMPDGVPLLEKPFDPGTLIDTIARLLDDDGPQT